MSPVLESPKPSSADSCAAARLNRTVGPGIPPACRPPGYRLSMPSYQFTVQTRGKGLYEFTGKVRDLVAAASIDSGLCTVFVRHTSASLIIQENADPSAKRDLEAWLERLVPEGDPLYTHTSEGPDDMPAHIKAALTSTSIAVPILRGELALGTWQGVFLWEHRSAPHERRIIVQIG